MLKSRKTLASLAYAMASRGFSDAIDETDRSINFV